MAGKKKAAASKQKPKPADGKAPKQKPKPVDEKAPKQKPKPTEEKAPKQKPQDAKTPVVIPKKEMKAKTKAARKQPRQRNYKLACGIYRFGRSRMFQRRVVYKHIKNAVREGKKTKKPQAKKHAVREKTGPGTAPKKLRRIYPTLERKRRPKKKVQKKAKLKKSLLPGTVVIILAGAHRGKRVIFLKQLARSGLLLVTGPFKFNGCPLRRIDQVYTIATSLRLDISGVKIPEHLNDKYFRRVRQKKSKKDDGDIFETKKGKYTPSEQRKQDQVEMDTQIMDVLRKHEEKKTVMQYLCAKFGLRRQQYPHRLKF